MVNGRCSWAEVPGQLREQPIRFVLDEDPG